MFEDVEGQISDVFRRELARLGGIKMKIVLIAHMYRFVQVGRFLNRRIDEDIAFPSEILDIIRQDRIEQTVSWQYNEILDKIDEMKQNQHSGWIYEYGKKIYLEISAYQPLRDERCFEVCLKAYLASEEACRQGTRARNLHDVSRLRHFDNILDFSGINFPATLRDIDIFEENNPSFSVNVFYPAPLKNDKEQATRKLDPLHISEYNYQREHLVDLILFTEGEEDLRDRRNINDIPDGLNTHYCLINGENGWNQIMRTWNKHHGRKYFCRHCMIPPFTKLDLLQEHIEHNCHGRNNPNAGQREIFPEKGMHIMKFKNYGTMENVPFYFVKDLEADSDPVEKNIVNEKTIKLQKQKPNSYGYTLIQMDGKLAKEVVRRTLNSIAESWESMQRDLEEIIKPKLRNPEKIIMTERDWQTHKSAIRCYICGAHHGCVKIKCEATEENLSEAVYCTEGLSIEEEDTFKKATKCCLCKMSLRADINDNRVRDHDHFTGKYRGPAHRRCNLLLRIKPDEIKIPLIYHGGKHYDFHHEVWELGLVSEDKIEIIADNMENYKTIIIGQIKFIDSCQFQFPSLEKVASNLCGQEKTPEQLAKCFPIMAQSLPQHLLPILTQKCEYPYELNDPDRFSRTELPSRKEFNTVLGGLNYCDQGCKKCKHEIKGKKCDGECKEGDLKEVDDCEHEKIYTISQKQYEHAQKWTQFSGSE
ncbi:hypothetical protein RclHR1_30280002 [Rhizophagus clarus]|uniref:C2H2-type domain-containing protein n=1 Tax=Rhizophagus clarus TaxID=94130 RepID=A0A2Z6RHV1_9GLOM|nr:hypothetical protein RclHR1_30280002 [Rhizophagus clarus]